MNSSQLKAGVAIADITPPHEVGLLTSSVNGSYAPFKSTRLPLKARVLALKSAEDIAVIVSLDLLALSDSSVGGWEKFKRLLSQVIEPGKIIITCTHTHNSPESVGLSNLYLTDVYQEWLLSVQWKVKAAIEDALNALTPCCVFFKSSVLEGYSLQRRIKSSNGIIMSDSVQPITPALMNCEPVDRRVSSIHIHDALGKPIATLVHAICHPVHEMCLPHISPDFPGEMCEALKASSENGMPFFFNGAAGNINPPTVSEGPHSAQEHGEALARVVQNKTALSSIDVSAFDFACCNVQLSPRPGADITNANDAVARFSAIRIGSLAIVVLPGEPFVEIAFDIENTSPFEHTIVVGFGENNIGYVPTEKAYEEGGYEIGPGKWSFAPKGTDKLVSQTAIDLLNKLYNKK